MLLFVSFVPKREEKTRHELLSLRFFCRKRRERRRQVILAKERDFWTRGLDRMGHRLVLTKISERRRAGHVVIPWHVDFLVERGRGRGICMSINLIPGGEERRGHVRIGIYFFSFCGERRREERTCG
jgi:hypothetical protein